MSADPFMGKIDGLAGLTTKIAARLATKPEIFIIHPAELRILRSISGQDLARLPRRTVGVWSAGSAGGRLNSTTTQVRAPTRLRRNVEGRRRDRAITQAALYSDCFDRLSPRA